ncbi:hypothetical protein [Nguyenibacter sp. L1]|uniref:hypothetical protein n=1 Tax=Nguyenibacter sp. L1 TaxID=3049350 RepID=UPI002B496C71|nr:hypothetical protein [Nguyenibacter sp. L1]WRH89606.1 hypothetical protein QN315_08455 [Nguyenibacter sp. L1]
MMKNLIAAGLALTGMASPIAARAAGAPIIEVVTAKLISDVTIAQMEAIDHEIGTNLIAKRPGFVSDEGRDAASLLGDFEVSFFLSA